MQDELVTALVPFSSLRVVDLVRPFDLLGFGNSFPEAAEIEAAIIQYTSRIAQRIPTIEAFHIDYLVTLGRNYFYGWLNVQQTLHGRHTVAPLWYKDVENRSAPVPPNNCTRYNYLPFYDVPIF